MRQTSKQRYFLPWRFSKQMRKPFYIWKATTVVFISDRSHLEILDFEKVSEKLWSTHKHMHSSKRTMTNDVAYWKKKPCCCRFQLFCFHQMRLSLFNGFCCFWTTLKEIREFRLFFRSCCTTQHLLLKAISHFILCCKAISYERSTNVRSFTR